MTNTTRFLLGTIAGTLLVVGGAAAETTPVRIQGAEPGRWTMDIDAAVATAGEKHLPIMLNFTGSDWCKWCKLMERQVFSHQEWSDFATSHLLLVWIDKPRDPSLVPAYLVARNRALARKYKLKGPPLYIILDDDGKTVLGRLGASRNATVKGFIEEVERICRYRPEVVDAFVSALSPEEAQAYRELAAKSAAARAALQKLPDDDSPATRAADATAASLEEAVERWHIDAKAKALGPEKGPRYKQLRTEQATAQKEFQAWLTTRPLPTPENEKVYNAFHDRLTALQAEIEKF